MENPEAGELYQHCEGEAIYEIIGMGKRIDTQEDVVCCIPVANRNGILVIPLELWFGTEECDEKVVPRFTKVTRQNYPIGTAYPPILKGPLKEFVETREESD